MERVRESLFSKKITINSNNPYNLALDILDSMSVFGKITERKHEYRTDGPRKLVDLVFDLEDSIDKHSSIIFSFRLNGETNGISFLKINLTGSFNLKMIGDKGLGSETFSEFYFESVFPSLKKSTGEKIDRMSKLIEKRIGKLGKRYS